MAIAMQVWSHATASQVRPFWCLVLVMLLGCSPILMGQQAASTSTVSERAMPEPRPIVFGVPSMGMTAFAIHVAKDQGMFAQRNLAASMVVMRSSTIMAALVNGELDFSNSTGSATRAALQGLPVRIIAYFQTEPFSLLVRPEIASTADLKGKRVAVSEFTSNSGVYLAHALEPVGLSLADIIGLNMAEAERMQALLDGHVEAAVFSPPLTQQMQAAGFRVLSGPEISDIPSNGLVTSHRQLQEAPDVVHSTLEALIDAVVWTRTTPETATTYFASKYDLPLGVARAAYQQQMSVLRWDYTDEQLEKAIRVALAAVGSSQQAAISDVIDLALFRDLVSRRSLNIGG